MPSHPCATHPFAALDSFQPPCPSTRLESWHGLAHALHATVRACGRIGETNYAIQPIEFIHKNNIPFIEGCIVKYIIRWKDKGGLKDLDKIRHYIDLLEELENADNT